MVPLVYGIGILPDPCKPFIPSPSLVPQLSALCAHVLLSSTSEHILPVLFLVPSLSHGSTLPLCQALLILLPLCKLPELLVGLRVPSTLFTFFQDSVHGMCHYDTGSPLPPLGNPDACMGKAMGQCLQTRHTVGLLRG